MTKCDRINGSYRGRRLSSDQSGLRRAPRRHHLRGWWSGTRGWESPADVFPPAGAGRRRARQRWRDAPTAPRCAHRRGRSDGRTQSPRPDDRCRESCYRSQGQFGASRTCSPGGSLRWRQRSARCPPARSARVPVAGRHRAHRRRDVSEAPSAAVSNAVGVDPPLRQLIGKPTATSAFAASLRARRSCSPASPGLPGA